MIFLNKMLIMFIVEDNFNCKVIVYIDYIFNSYSLYFRYEFLLISVVDIFGEFFYYKIIIFFIKYR